MDDGETYLKQAIALARSNVEAGGRPFGAVLVHDGAVVATPGLYPIHPSPLDCWRIMPDGYRVIFDDHRWETLTRGMWGTAERASFEYAHNTAILAGSPTLTVEEALAQPTFVEGTDGRCPLQVWWVGRKR